VALIVTKVSTWNLRVFRNVVLLLFAFLSLAQMFRTQRHFCYSNFFPKQEHAAPCFGCYSTSTNSTGISCCSSVVSQQVQQICTTIGFAQQCSLDSASPDFSKFRFVRTNVLLSRPLLCSVQNSPEVRICMSASVFQALLYLHSAVSFVCVPLQSFVIKRAEC
jgi:hypothetical protein